MSRNKNVQDAREIYLELKVIYDKAYAVWLPKYEVYEVEWEKFILVPWQQRDPEKAPRQPRKPKFEPLLTIMSKLGVSRRTALEYIDVIKFLER